MFCWLGYVFSISSMLLQLYILQVMQQESEDSLLLHQSKVAELTEEINQLERAKSRLEWMSVGEKSYQKLKKYLWRSFMLYCFSAVLVVVYWSILLVLWLLYRVWYISMFAIISLTVTYHEDGFSHQAVMLFGCYSYCLTMIQFLGLHFNKYFAILITP